MKNWLISISVILGIGLFWYYSTHPLKAKVRIQGTIFSVDVAATEAQKQKGLGGRKTLLADQGMLFPYDHKETYNFWMRGMLFPLDFIWIDGKIIADLTENVQPPQNGENPVVVKPAVPVDKVLEVSAGTINRLGITIGDRVDFLDR